MPVSRFLYRNTVCEDDGTVLGEFSGHGVALCALIRLEKPDYEPLGGWMPADLRAFETMKKKIENDRPKS